MSPVFHREDGFCFRIFSNEESRKHIHVEKAGKRAKFWLEPSFELSENYGFTDREINKIFKIISNNGEDFKAKYTEHIGKRSDD